MSQPSNPDTEKDFAGHVAAVTPETAEWVQVGRNRAAPRRFAVRWKESQLPLLRLELETGDDGKVLCRSLTVEHPERPGVSAQLVRSVPVARVIREATAAATRMLELSADGTASVRDPSWDERQSFVASLPARTLRPSASEDLLEDIAAVYRANPKTPAKAVHEYLCERLPRGVSRATVGRYIAQARETGKLGKAMPRKAGER